MTAIVLRALLAEAFHQVVDSRAFRVLLLLALLPIVLAFLVGFRESEIVLAFGWKRFSYADAFDAFGRSASAGTREGLIGLAVKESLAFLTGPLSVLIAVVATAFLVPRMLEKGMADTLFSKPVSRLMLLLSRYVAGLLFVGLLTLFLVSGVALGLLVSSGWSDASIFWRVLQVLYVFAVLHAVSVAVGVWTRSTSAAVLLTAFFAAGNGCVHATWGLKETLVQTQASEGGTPSGWAGALSVASDVLHFTLPRTGDAGRMVATLSGEPEPRPRPSPPGKVVLEAPPADWDAPWRRNLLLSLATTVAFTLAVLFLGWLKLDSIDL